MERLAMETENITDKNIQKILELFPNVATEGVNDNGEIVRAIDFNKLKQELSEDIVDGQETYDFTWVGKREAMIEANRPIRKTLRPDRESSVNWDTTENIYIEGDNLDALKLLQESYMGKIKMIYIDPPYNTGNDSFAYNDKFIMDKDEYDEYTEYCNEHGINFSKNEKTNPRYHSNWCSMLFSRLKLARTLLSKDGVIFISIDDNEINNLSKICDEIFGRDNFLANLIIESAPAGTQSSVDFAIQQSYCLVYRNSCEFRTASIPLTQDEIKNKFSYAKDDEGWFYIERLWKRGVGGRKEDVPSLHFPVYYEPQTQKIFIEGETLPDKELIKIIPYQTQNVLGRWTWSKQKMISEKNHLIVVKIADEWKLHKKVYYNSTIGKKPFTIISSKIGRTELGSLEIKELFGEKVFVYPKFSNLIKYFLSLHNEKDITVLDFFSGSATTAHACMQLNAEDGGNRKFIMVQLPEVCDEKSEAYKAGYKNICQIGEERIRRAGKKIQEENPDKKIDIGFRVFKVDDTNMKDVYYTPNETAQKQLGMFESNIKDDRTDEDLLYGCLLDWGVELSLPHKVEVIDGKRVHIVNEQEGLEPDLIACFEDSIPESVIRKIAEKKPTRVVFRDSSFVSDDNKINVEEIFKLITPDTKVKVI